jgi:hypothetical protein
VKNVVKSIYLSGTLERSNMGSNAGALEPEKNAGAFQKKTLERWNQKKGF